MKKDDLKIKKITMTFEKDKKSKNPKQVLKDIEEITNKLLKAERQEDEKSWFDLIDQLSQLTGDSRDHIIFDLVTIKRLIIDAIGEKLKEMKEREQAHD